jgi:hypothetical protein
MNSEIVKGILNDLWFIKDLKILSESGMYYSKVKIPKYESINRYIAWYVKRYDKHDELRAAIKQECPEHEETIDKLLILK